MLDSSNLSMEAADSFEELLGDALIDLEELIEEVVTHREESIDDLANSGEFVDEELVGALAARSLELLERIAEDYTEEEHRLAQAAVRYFLIDLDGDFDYGSPVGFDDDREVFNAVVLELGHEDLQIGF